MLLWLSNCEWNADGSEGSWLGFNDWSIGAQVEVEVGLSLSSRRDVATSCSGMIMEDRPQEKATFHPADTILSSAQAYHSTPWDASWVMISIARRSKI